MRPLAALLLVAGCTAPNPEFRHLRSTAPPTETSPADLGAPVNVAPTVDMGTAPIVVSPTDVDMAPRDLALVAPDDLAHAACDPATQAGCIAGQKCSVVSGKAVCMPDGAKPAGAPCTVGAGDDCVRGNICVDSLCHPLCDHNPDCTQPAVDTGTWLDNVPYCLVADGFAYCSIACNPVPAVGPSGCGAGINCAVFGVEAADGGVTFSTTCTVAGVGADGDPCSRLEDCGPGLTCFSDACRPACRAGTRSDCPTGERCETVTSEPFSRCCPTGGC
jgi:hypothetical protein